jgi:uncharacterized protein YutE (UPF0331/DUF86 family)
MRPEIGGITRRLEKLRECLGKLEPLRKKRREEFARQPYLRDIVERNLEVAIQCLIDMGNRIISIEDAEKPKDYYEIFLILGSLQVLPSEFAKQIAPMAGFRNILVHDYVSIDWDLVHDHLQKLGDFYDFERHIKKWLKRRPRRSGTRRS